MTHTRRINLIMWAGAILLGAVFAYAAWPKIADPSLFGQSIQRYALLPNRGVSLLAIYLPWVEMCAAAFVLWPRYRVAAATLIAAMLVVFLVAQGSALARGLEISCGCFSGSGAENKIGWDSLLRNACLLLIALILACKGRASARNEA
ncbi:MAG: DoxX family protein [Kiritimatiellae bacterium]|nr:DoxX family protein [Kiritimatiellia bacterium]